jgi:ribonuclease-3
VISLDQFQQANGLRFRSVALLQEALTHRSYINEHDAPDQRDNERLEFLGDAVIGFIAADLVFRQQPDADEGGLTRLRAALVRTETLAGLALECRVGEALRLGRGEEQNGGRVRPNNLCGAFEALIGALYVDAGLEAARAFLEPKLRARLETTLNTELDKDARSLLQERIQSRFGQTPVYRVSDVSGPEHAREFTVEVLLDERVIGIGAGRSKQAASQAAASAALKLLDEDGHDASVARALPPSG